MPLLPVLRRAGRHQRVRARVRQGQYVPNMQGQRAHGDPAHACTSCVTPGVPFLIFVAQTCEDGTGNCLPLANDERCNATGPEYCGHTGACDVAGTCLYYATGTPCRAVCDSQGAGHVEYVCNNATHTCEGDGSPATPCGLFACSEETGKCRKDCAEDTHCAPSAVCGNGECVPAEQNEGTRGMHGTVIASERRSTHIAQGERDSCNQGQTPMRASAGWLRDRAVVQAGRRRTWCTSG